VLGDPYWPGGGVSLCDAEGERVLTGMVADGAGGAIVAWEDYRSGSDADIYLARVSATGGIPWTTDGVAVCSAVGNQMEPVLTSDNAGGAIVAWTDYRGGAVADIYAGRVDATGVPMWIPAGTPVCAEAGHQAKPAIVSDGGGSVVIAWEDNRSGMSIVYLQRLDSQYGEWGHPEPELAAVSDVAGDQGGFVTLEWNASQREIPGQQLIGHYSVWRATDIPGVASPPTWELVGIQDATFQPTYAFVAPTLVDWTPSDPADHDFMIAAHALADPAISWPSEIASGHSVDNLAPPAPTSLVAERLATGDVQLTWDAVGVPDFAHYAVYRWKQPGPSQLIMTPTGPNAMDVGAPPGELRYFVTAFDVHDNESEPSNEEVVDASTDIGNTPAPTALTVRQNHPNPFQAMTEFEIGLPASSVVSIEVFDVAGRRVSTMEIKGAKAGWNRVPFAGRDERGRPLASGVYFYRIHASGWTTTEKMVITR
jgi:hypothetical protein